MRRTYKKIVLAMLAASAFVVAAVPAQAGGSPGQQRFFQNDRFANRWGRGMELPPRFLVGWCRRDAAEVCPDVSGGIDAHKQCMTTRIDQLSLGCQTAIRMVQDRGLRRAASFVRID